jgi:hypothetical protein
MVNARLHGLALSTLTYMELEWVEQWQAISRHVKPVAFRIPRAKQSNSVRLTLTFAKTATASLSAIK